MPVASKIEFCKFCRTWAGQDGEMYRKTEGGEKEVEGRVPLPWELLQPVIRILGHCLLGPNNRDVELFDAASEACRCLFARTMHDVNPKAILPIRSLMTLSNNLMDKTQLDPTELPFTDVISL
uniref:Hyccin n=2 Tax=Cajanus cajan TaxID=3821 RepID=A0A151U1K1_CAJCA|nr:hypothetical protein KK1_005790 [Cajanus cajan]